MDALRQSLASGLICGACALATQASVAGNLDLRSIIFEGEQSQSGFLAVGGGLTKALAQKSGQIVETTLQPAALVPVVPVSLRADRGPDVEAVVVDGPEADANAGRGEAKRSSKAKAEATEKSRPATARARSIGRADRRRAGAQLYDVPTAAIMANELEHAAKTGKKLAGEP